MLRFAAIITFLTSLASTWAAIPRVLPLPAGLAAVEAANETSTMQWSARSQMLVFTDAATNIVGRVFDGAGNQITLTNRDGNLWTFKFDGANRLTNATSPMTNLTAHFWNNRGLPASVVEPSGHTTTFG